MLAIIIANIVKCTAIVNIPIDVHWKGWKIIVTKYQLSKRHLFYVLSCFYWYSLTSH